MKIIFKDPKIKNGTIKVSTDGGINYIDYRISEVLENGISLGDLKDFTNVKIKGPANIFQSADVVSSIKLDDGSVKYTIDTDTNGSAFPACVTEINFPEWITSIDSIGGLSSCKNLTSINIPNGATKIDSNTFQNCSKLTNVNIPNSVTTIGSSAFYNCINLRNINIPNTVTYIRDYAFSGCKSLTSINIPESVTNISDGAFRQCENLYISVDKNNQSYYSSGGVLFNKDKTTLICYPSIRGSYSVPSYVMAIGKEAFFGCTNLTSLYIQNGVTIIGYYAFGNCTNLTSVTIPNSVTEISAYAFSGCSGITSVNYLGNQTQWESVLKSTNWDKGWRTDVKYNYLG